MEEVEIDLEVLTAETCQPVLLFGYLHSIPIGSFSVVSAN